MGFEAACALLRCFWPGERMVSIPGEDPARACIVGDPEAVSLHDQRGFLEDSVLALDGFLLHHKQISFEGRKRNMKNRGTELYGPLYGVLWWKPFFQTYRCYLSN